MPSCGSATRPRRNQYKHAEQAHILHILIKVDPNATPQQDAEAKAKADVDREAAPRAAPTSAKLAKREFAAIRRRPARAATWASSIRGTTVEPFDTAAFSIPLNTISDPIRSKEFGYHIIKVLERRRPATARSRK